MGFKIEKMYAFICVDPADGDEGVPSWTTPSGEHFPLMGADMRRIESIRPLATVMARRLNVPLTLCVFETRKEIDIIVPKEPGRA